jgi:hypothetical protein
VDGDYYLDTANGDVYSKAGGVWNVVGNILGPQGPPGAAGVVGSLWYVGVGAPAGGLGVDGDFYLNSANGDTYQKAAGVWVLQANLTGPAGANGADGADGVDFAASYSTLGYAATVNIDLTSAYTYLQISLTGDLELTTSNRAAARNKVIFLVCDGSNRSLTFPVGWTFVNSTGEPTTLTANKTGVLSIVCRDGNDSGVLACYTEQP